MPRIVCHDVTNGNEEGGRKAMENCLQKDPDINVVYTINEPAAAGAYEALKAVGKEKDVLIVSVDGGCPGVKNVAEGVIGATSQQYPLLMASMGIEAIKKFAETGKKPKPTEGKTSSTPAPRWSPTSRSRASSRSTPRPAWRSAGAEPQRLTPAVTASWDGLAGRLRPTRQGASAARKA